MKTIALTGHPTIQHFAAGVLQDLIADRRLPLRVRAGLTRRDEAYTVHAEGGEIWLCGADAPARDLVGLIDRTVPLDASGIGSSVLLALDAFLTKTPIGEPA